MMKKVLIILSVVLVVFSFVSCRKDKSEEIIKNYEDYVESRNVYTINTNLMTSYTSKFPKGKVEADISNETFKDMLCHISTAFKNNRGNLWREYGLSDDVKSVEIVSTTVDSGTLNGTITDDEVYEYTLSDVKVNFTYNICDKNGDKLNFEPIETVFTASMKLEHSYTNGVRTDSISSLTLNGVTYRDLYLRYDSVMGEYTDVRIEGESVDLRLINGPKKNL